VVGRVYAVRKKASGVIEAPGALYETRGAHCFEGHRVCWGAGSERQGRPSFGIPGLTMPLETAARCGASVHVKLRPAPLAFARDRRARRRGRDRHERGKRLGEAGPLSQREETQTDSRDVQE